MFSLPRFFQHAQRLPYAYRLGLAASIALYLVLYAGLLAYTRALPYVMDNNESFSAFVHASNLYHFPLSRTLGLTDEAFSADEAAHPYVYTHQGNFPRVFAFVLYVLGARTIESQIVITTFTVGLLAVFLIYHYFSTVASPLFAFIVSAVALTDYLFFAQWQVNTFRVWHGLFLYLALLCVHGVGGPHRGRWLILTAVAYACMFYFELVFATFVAVMAGLYAGVRYWRRPALLAGCWSVQVAGAVLAVVILVGQLVAYLGWTDFVQDLRFTYGARNLIAQDPTYIDRVREFVESRRLVFWYNFASVDYQRSAGEILSSITNGYFTAYTPTLWYFVTVVITGWLAGLRRPQQVAHFDHTSGPGVQGDGRMVAAVQGVLLVVAWARFLMAVVQADGLTGVGGSRLSFDVDTNTWIAGVAAVLAVGCALVIGRLATGQWSGLRRLPAARVLLAAGTLLLAEHIVLNSATLFDPFFVPLWSYVQGTWFPGWAVQLALVGAAGVAVLLNFNLPITSDVRWSALASYLACGLLAYVVVYMLSPGYVQSGYLERLAPFASLVLEVAIALAIYIVGCAGYRLLQPHVHWSRLRQRSSARAGDAGVTSQATTANAQHRGELGFALVLKLGGSSPFVHARIRLSQTTRRILSAMFARITASCAALLLFSATVLLPLLATALLLFPAMFWVNLQARHARLLPATHFGFMKQLRETPFRGASFAANTYAAPIYAYTGQWAYFDTGLALPDGGAVSLTDEGYVVSRDARSYLWLADRELNKKYQRPNYFLCFRYQDLRTAVYRLRGIDVGCSSAGIVKRANNREPLTVADAIVARDASGQDSWAIVKLDWSILERRGDVNGRQPLR